MIRDSFVQVACRLSFLAGWPGVTSFPALGWERGQGQDLQPEEGTFAPTAARWRTRRLDSRCRKGRTSPRQLRPRKLGKFGWERGCVWKTRGELENMHAAHKACVDWSKGVSLGIRASPREALWKKDVSIE